MNDKDIEKLIEQLRNQKNYDEAYIGYFQYGGQPDESYIKANRQGLELHAAELLEAALETKAGFEDNKMKTFGLDEGISDIEGDYFFQYVELIKEVRSKVNPNSDYQQTWKDKAIEKILIGVLISIPILAIIGFIKIIQWIIY